MKIGVILPAAQVEERGRTPGWQAVRSFALAAESHGLDSVWMFDHFFDRSRPWTQGMQEAWTIVAAVAAVTRRVEIGTLALCASFRNPGLVAKMAVPALGTAALVERTRGDIVGAVRLVEEWFELNRATAHWLGGLNLLDALAVLASAPALDSARTLLEWFAPRCVHEECALVTGRAILHEAVGELEDGARLYADAAERWRSFGHVLEVGRCHLGAGRCLLLMTLPAEASEHLREAREVLAGIDARPLIAEVDLLQERASALTSS